MTQVPQGTNQLCGEKLVKPTARMPSQVAFCDFGLEIDGSQIATRSSVERGHREPQWLGEADEYRVEAQHLQEKRYTSPPVRKTEHLVLSRDCQKL
jgi:hypothetical protein